MTFERSEDWELVKQIVTHEKIYPHVSDDFAPPAAEWEPTKHPDVLYVVARDGEEVLGLWALIPENRICMKVHTCLLPGAWGERARRAASEFIPWVWANTGCQRLNTDVPEFNRIALRFALQGGFTQFGVNPKSFKKNGKLWDQIMLGISRPGVN